MPKTVAGLICFIDQTKSW